MSLRSHWQPAPAKVRTQRRAPITYAAGGLGPFNNPYDPPPHARPAFFYECKHSCLFSPFISVCPFLQPGWCTTILAAIVPSNSHHIRRFKLV